MCKGFLQGVVNILCNELDEQYYLQLRNCQTAYRNITPFQILDHVDSHWCALDVKAKKALKDAYYTKWNGNEHLIAFSKHLDEDKCTVI
jgi:hypothetical protein